MPTTASSCFSRKPIPQEILTNHRKSTNSANNTAQPGQHQKAHNDDDIPPQPTQVHLNNLSHTDSLSFSQIVPASPPGSLTEQDWRASARPMEEAWQKVKSHAERKPGLT